MPEQAWQTRYAQLSKYRETYGDCLVPQRFHPNPQLGFWWVTEPKTMKMLSIFLYCIYPQCHIIIFTNS
jgi:hypothetical protein